MTDERLSSIDTDSPRTVTKETSYKQWTDIKSVPTLSDYFELDLHSFGTKFTNTGIYEAIKTCNLLQLQKCIEYGENVRLVEDEFGTTFLLYVVNCADRHCERDYLPMLHELALAGCDVNLNDLSGRSPLGECIKKNLEEMMVSLLQLGAEGSESMVELIDRYSGPFHRQTVRWYQKHTPSLRQAIESEDIRTIKRLISHWCRVNVKYDGVSLHDIARGLFGRQHIICDLLESHFHTLEFIHSALAGNKRRVLDFKLNHHCDYNWLNKGYQRNLLEPLQPRSIYDSVVELGHNHILDIIPKPTSRPIRNSLRNPDAVESRLCLIS